MSDTVIHEYICSKYPHLADLEPDAVARVVSEDGLFFELFGDDAVALAELCTLEGQRMRLPRKPQQIMGEKCLPGIRDLFEDIVTLRVTDAVVLADRGGGKSGVVGVAAFVTWALANWDWFVLGGSEYQAGKVYGYYRENVDRFAPYLPVGFVTKLTMQESRSSQHGQVGIAAASPKRVRSPHMGNETKPGVLVVDEEMEAEGDLVEIAMFVISTANPPVTIRTSTAHKAEGPFLDVFDGAPGNGYRAYQWDTFDVAQACPYECAECPVEDFAHDIYEYDEASGQNVLIHRAYCAGKAKLASGWIPVDSIVRLWFKVPRHVFEREAMGWRVADTNYVVVDRKALLRAFEHDMPIFQEERDGVIAIDWGFSGETAVGLLLADEHGRPTLVRYRYYSRAPIEVISQYVASLFEQFGVGTVYADSSHPFNNSHLRRMGFLVKPIFFDRCKAVAVTRLNAHIEHGTFVVPVNHLPDQQQRLMTHLLDQLRGWRKKGGMIIKRNDHACDMLICAMMYFAPLEGDVVVDRIVRAPEEGVADFYDVEFDLTDEGVVRMLLLDAPQIDGPSRGPAGPKELTGDYGLSVLLGTGVGGVLDGVW